MKKRAALFIEILIVLALVLNNRYISRLIFLVLLDTIVVYFIVVRVIGFINLQRLNHCSIAAVINKSLYSYIVF